MPPASQRPFLWIAAAAMFLAAQAPALAQYTWKDSKGQLHASDQPPPRDIPDKDVIRRPSAARPVPTTAAPASAVPAARLGAASAPVDPELQQRRARAEQEARAKAQADEQRASAQREQNCRRARQHLATLDNGARLVRIDARGERVVVDDAQRAQEAAQARGVMAADCR